MGPNIDFLDLGIHGLVDRMNDRSKIVISTPFIGLTSALIFSYFVGRGKAAGHIRFAQCRQLALFAPLRQSAGRHFEMKPGSIHKG
jgi:hypothetical protein